MKFLKILRGEAPFPLWMLPAVPASWAYSLAVRIRAGLYRYGVIKAKRLSVPVISVGNLAPGGTGKTPFTMELCGRLLARGIRPAILTRGYGGTKEGRVAEVSDGQRVLLDPSSAGDEAVMLADRLPGVPVVMGASRYESGLLAIKRFSPDVLVLDDGYQHISLHRDLDILLLDAGRPFGNGYTLPAGYLREPASAADRAGLIVLTRADGVSGPPAGLPDRPVALAVHRPVALSSLRDGHVYGLETLTGKTVLPVCAIAYPGSFTLILKGLGAKIKSHMFFRDHHAYTAADMVSIADLAVKSCADLVVTTEKDAVKLSRLTAAGPDVMVLKVGMEFIGDGRDSTLERALDTIFGES